MRKIIGKGLRGAIALGILLVVFVSSGGFPAVAASSGGLEKVRQTFIDAYLEKCSVDDAVWDSFMATSGIDPSEKGIRPFYTVTGVSENAVYNLMDKFDFKKGVWTDIDYNDDATASWPAGDHLTRIGSLAKFYKVYGQEWKDAGKLLSMIHTGLAWWFRHLPESRKWWYNEIGVPRNMGIIMLFIKEELSEKEFEAGVKVMERTTFGRTSANKVDQAAIVLMRGLLTDDEALVLRARNVIAEEICVTKNAEGIQDDWSFHQHGSQAQFGGYGLVYIQVISLWYWILSGTEFAFSDKDADILCNFVKEGLSWPAFKGVMDPNFSGRQNYSDAARRKVSNLILACRRMSAGLKQDAEAASGDRAAELSEKADFFGDLAKSGLFLSNSPSSPVGAKYYNRSDCGVYRTDSWYSSVRMHSRRTIGFEMITGTNTLANFSADGAVLLMQDGREYENVFACWDWRKVPGVTAYDDGKPIKFDDSVLGKRNNSEHVAGKVTETSEGTVLAASMELNRDGLHALKSAFFFNDCVVALGTDITFTNPDFRSVTTAVDQTRLKGDVVSDRDDGEGFAHVIWDSLQVSWVHHNGRGYVSLDGAPMMVSRVVQGGDWGKIRAADKGKTDQMPMFKCWFEHPMESLETERGGSYAYAILPCVSASETAGFLSEFSEGEARVSVLMNTAECQAVRFGSVVCAVVHKVGVYEFDGVAVHADKPCITVIDGDSVSVEYFPETIEDLARRVFALAEGQFTLLDGNVSALENSEKLYPRSLDPQGVLVTSDINWWCSGFYPGSLWLMYEYTGKEEWKDMALKYTLPLEPLSHRTDICIGFQLMSGFGNALRLTGNKEFEKVITDGAASFAKRYKSSVGCIKSWDWGDDKWDFPVIIDNMPSIELLFKGAEISGVGRYRDIASTHAKTTKKNHFRSDYSSYHLVNYDSVDGHVISRQTVQGYSDGSAWSRGQAWGLYGFTMAHRFTGDRQFYSQALAVATYLLGRLPDDCIPYWDYDSPAIPRDFKDASAAAIMASALVELSSYTSGERTSLYLRAARKMIDSLASEEYLAKEGELCGFLLKHSVGNKPAQTEVDAPQTFADYYFLEAVLRLLKFDNIKIDTIIQN